MNVLKKWYTHEKIPIIFKSSHEAGINEDYKKSRSTRSTIQISFFSHIVPKMEMKN